MRSLRPLSTLHRTNDPRVVRAFSSILLHFPALSPDKSVLGTQGGHISPSKHASVALVVTAVSSSVSRVLYRSPRSLSDQPIARMKLRKARAPIGDDPKKTGVECRVGLGFAFASYKAGACSAPRRATKTRVYHVQRRAVV